jgi:predicted transglutaminase-like cysteine proteinase
MDNHGPTRRNEGHCIGLAMWVAQVIVLVGITVVILSNVTESTSAESFFPLPAATAPIQAVGPATPIDAWTRFCNRLPQECRVNVSQTERVSLSPPVWETINEINERVNSMILSVTDEDHWGVVDRWDYPDDGLGDCEDIQLLKRRFLVAAGLPQRALRMTVVADERGDGHAVLMVLTDRGDFILDNKRNAVLPWRSTGYTYLMREGTNGKGWVALADRPVPLVTANR